MMPEVDLYLRKSKIVRDEDPRDLTSIIAQEERGRAWAAKHGCTVRHVWIDNLSAWSDVRRPKFDAALAALANGDVPVLWCAFLDRFSRKGIDDIGPILGKARVIFDYEGLDSANERDRRWIIDRAEQAREFSMRLSYNVRSTKASQRDRGMWLGKAPYGMEIADARSRKLRRSANWQHVEALFTALAEGESQRAICKRLNAAGIASPTGGQWAVSTVSYMLTHPVYEGWQVVRSEVHRDAAGERISVMAPGEDALDSDLVARARASARGFLPIAAKQGVAKHELTDLTFCASCGSSASCTGQNYVCAAYISGRTCEAPVIMRRLSLENFVRDSWVARLSASEPDDPLLATVAYRYAALRAPKSTTELREAEAALSTALAGVQRIADSIAAGMFEPPFDTHLPRLQREAREAFLAAQSRVAKLAPPEIDISFLLEAESALAAWESADTALRRDLVRSTVSKIIIRKGRQGARFKGHERVTIQWHGDV